MVIKTPISLNRWLVIFAAAVILMITMGMRMSLGLFVLPINHHMELSLSDIAFAMAICQLMWGVAQPLSGAAADRWGALPVLQWGAFILALGCVLLPLLPNFWGLILSIGILLALGSGAGSHSVLMSLVAQRVPLSFRGTASGIVNAGGSFGQLIFAPLLQSLILLPSIGWRGAAYALSIVALLILPLSRLLFVAQSVECDTSNSAAPINQNTPFKQMLKEAFSNRSYWLLHAGFFTCGFHIAFLVTHLPNEVALCGLPPDVASWSLAVIGGANIIGSLLVGWLVGKMRSKFILFFMYGSRSLLIVAYLLMPRTDWTFYVFAFGLGLTWLATVPPTVAITGKLFGTRYLATLFGFTLLSHQIGGFFGAWLGGKAVISFGDYGWMWYADLILAGIAALCHLPIQEKKISNSTS